MFKTILVPVDLSQEENSAKAMAQAVELAKAFSSRLHVVTVVPDYGFHYVAQFFPDGYEHKMIKDAMAKLEAFVAETVPQGIEVGHSVCHGSIYMEIVAKAEEIGADLILMASHSPEISDFLVGPNAEKVLHYFKGSVFVLRP